MSESLLANKLETAFVAWLNTNKGSDLSGVTICAARATTEQAVPYIAVYCPRAPKHPDMVELTGAMLPRRAELQFLTASHTREGAFAAKAGQWAAELSRLMAGTTGTFSTLITALNPPASGADTRTVTDLKIFGISLMDESSSNPGSEWHEQLILEVDAMASDS